jgi:hypothetical protein
MAGSRGRSGAREAAIRQQARCGGPGVCTVKGLDHDPDPGTRRIWTFHDRQCQVANPDPGPHLDGYPECALIDLHEGDHDYTRHAAAEIAAEPEIE